MNERRLDSVSYDIYYDSVNRCVARSVDFADSMAQRIKSYLQTFVGECFSDRSVGVEWYDKVLGATILTDDAAKAELKEKMEQIAHVAEVRDISVEIEGRNTKFVYTVVLDDGTEIKDVV